ncbi:MAG: hypothetical protein LBJ36_00290 [Synergistaceae bacterium]|jgi:signal transduction histidine kinase|nr:hypothetical protein [Synergistaceae bacterium]
MWSLNNIGRPEEEARVIKMPIGWEIMFAALLAGIFHVKQAIAEENESKNESENEGKKLKKLLDALNGNVYVWQYETRKLLYANREAREVLGPEIAPPCPYREAQDDSETRWTWESYDPRVKKHYRNTVSLIDWTDGIKAYVQHSVDVSDYAEATAAHQRSEAALMRHEESLQIALESAQKANDAKSEFLSRMSHEIRTPMNVIIGMTKIAQQTQDMDKAQDCLKKIDLSAKHLRGIIDDILDVSRIETRKLQLTNASFDVRKMLMNIYDEFAIKSQEKQQQLSFQIDNSVGTLYVGDEARLSQVLLNVLSNAIKFTSENGHVILSVRQRQRQRQRLDDKAVLEISVEDSGIGISKENQEKIFSPFEQADGGIARKFGGTGLGLVICKNIVELMGGSIFVRSKEGKGSVFFFTVELQVVDKAVKENLKRDPKGDSLLDFAGADIPSRFTPDAASQEKKHGGDEKKKKMIDTPTFDTKLMLPFINVAEGLARFKGNGKLYATLLRSYQKNELFPKIKAAIDAKNLEVALSNIRALNGIAASLSLNDLSAKTALLEDSLRGGITSQTLALVGKLATSMKEARQWLPDLILVLEEGRIA